MVVSLKGGDTIAGPIMESHCMAYGYWLHHSHGDGVDWHSVLFENALLTDRAGLPPTFVKNYVRSV